MRVYLHAGHFKTGTTAFQQLLARNAGRLQQHSIYVPSMPRGNHGYHFRRSASSGDIDSELSDELAAARARGYAACILSAEVVSHFDEDEMAALHRLLAPYRTTFVLVLRHWFSFLPSRYGQNVRRCDFLPLAEYVWRLQDEGDRHPDANFALVLERALKVFGEAWALPYGPDVAPRAILADAGVSQDEISRMLEGAQPANVSFDHEFVEILRVVNAAVGRSLGLAPDQKYAQVFDRRRPIRLLRLDGWLPRLRDGTPDLYEALRQAARDHARMVDLGILRPQVAQWHSNLERLSARPELDWRLRLDEVAAPQLWASDTQPDDLPDSLRTEVVARALAHIRGDGPA